jgi:RNA-directed DNA polymerase
MQRKLSLRAAREPEHKFGSLYSLLYNEDWLRTAYEHVRQNAGKQTAGCDGMPMGTWEANLEYNQQKLRADLKAATFEPCPVRRVYIRERKPDGRTKARPLGIPTIRDRIVQEALRMILEPIFEADFTRHSYGFRPGRSTKDAADYIVKRLTGRSRVAWVIEGDIQSYFDTLSHRKLLHLLRRRVKDERLLGLIWKFLRAGRLEEGKLRASLTGTPQGGIVSPVLANIYLHQLDKYMERYTALSAGERRARRKKGHPNFFYVRYADDWVVLCEGTKGDAQALKQELGEFLEKELRLTLSLEKTNVTHIKEGFTFLGFLIDKAVGGRGRCIPRIRIPLAAVRKLRGKYRAALSPSTHHESLRVKILGLNRIIRGWCHYYQTTSSPSYFFNRLDNEVFWAMAHWLGRKYRLPMPRVMRRFRKENTFGTPLVTLLRLSDFKAQRYPVRTLRNPYTLPTPAITRDEVPALAGVGLWEERAGQADLREAISLRDHGRCGLCGRWVPWHAVILDHKRPWAQFAEVRDADRPENLWVLHREPCNREKTKRDLQVLSRMR